ncbi:MAG: aminotransferase class V-fold PLP-dependent enzyme [Planctomycetaceae bacterium]|nr:aminotransferase class V-fold PLP-dependent enzyme [Planctomycetaceae bacterium]
MSDLPAILGGAAVRPEGPPGWPLPDGDIRRALAQLAESGDWGRYEAQHCESLRKEIATRHQRNHVLLTSSGTAAVELALRGLGVGQGDEVILAAYDFKANFTNVAMLGATPVLVEIREDDGQIDLERIPGAISEMSKAILVSHLHGGTVDMAWVTEMARQRGIAVIEDACQMPLAVVQGQAAGSWGDVGVLSFGGSKLLTAGRGGAIVTDRDDISQRVSLYNQRGNLAYPLSEMQAAVLLPQLESLPERRAKRAEAVAHLRECLSQRSALIAFAPSKSPQTDPDYYKLGFWYSSANCGHLSRERFCEAMRAEGIPVDPGFRALHKIHARRRFRVTGTLETADRADESLVVLHHPLLLEGPNGTNQFVQALDKVQRHATMIANR